VCVTQTGQLSQLLCTNANTTSSPLSATFSTSTDPPRSSHPSSPSSSTCIYTAYYYLPPTSLASSAVSLRFLSIITALACDVYYNLCTLLRIYSTSILYLNLCSCTSLFMQPQKMQPERTEFCMCQTITFQSKVAYSTFSHSWVVNFSHKSPDIRLLLRLATFNFGLHWSLASFLSHYMTVLRLIHCIHT